MGSDPEAHSYILRYGRAPEGKPLGSSEADRGIQKERLSGPPRRWQLACNCTEFKNEMTLDEVAAAYGISRERVSQIKIKAVRRLRDSGNESIREYIG